MSEEQRRKLQVHKFLFSWKSISERTEIILFGFCEIVFATYVMAFLNLQSAGHEIRNWTLEQAETFLKGNPALKGDLPARVNPRREWVALVWCNDAAVDMVPVTLPQLSDRQLSVLKKMFHVAESGAELIPAQLDAIKTFRPFVQSSPQDLSGEERQEAGGHWGHGDSGGASAGEFITLLRRAGGRTTVESWGQT